MDPAEHRAERRANLVRQRRQEFVLGARRRFRLQPRIFGGGNLGAELLLRRDALADVADEGDRADDVLARP
jgi:hypothetical protein